MKMKGAMDRITIDCSSDCEIKKSYLHRLTHLRYRAGLCWLVCKYNHLFRCTNTHQKAYRHSTSYPIFQSGMICCLPSNLVRHPVPSLAERLLQLLILVHFGGRHGIFHLEADRMRPRSGMVIPHPTSLIDPQARVNFHIFPHSPRTPCDASCPSNYTYLEGSIGFFYAPPTVWSNLHVG